VSETPVATETSWSPRTVTIASLLFLLVLLPAHSQSPTSPTPSRRNPRMLDEYRRPASPGDVIANPSAPTRPPRTGNTASPTTSPRPSPTVASPIPITVKLKSDKETVQTEQPVKFRAILTPPFREAIYMFHADSSPIEGGRDKNEAVTRFSTPGRHLVSVQVRVHGMEATDSTTVQVEGVPRSNPTPSATASVPASPSPYSPSPTAIVPGGFITATPPGSGSNIASPTATRSSPKPYTATPTPVLPNGRSASQRRWLIFYIVTAGLAAAALYGILKLIKPMFHLHADWNEPQKSPRNVAINYGLYFHSNVSAGQDRLQTDGASLILRRRTQ